MRLAQDDHHRYYDADRFGDNYDWWNDTNARLSAKPYLCILGTADIKEESEEEVLARNPREAREVMRAAIERDFEKGTLVTKVVLV